MRGGGTNLISSRGSQSKAWGGIERERREREGKSEIRKERWTGAPSAGADVDVSQRRACCLNGPELTLVPKMRQIPETKR